MFMQTREQAKFESVLASAIEDLLNTRPADPREQLTNSMIDHLSSYQEDRTLSGSTQEQDETRLEQDGSKKFLTLDVHGLSGGNLPDGYNPQRRVSVCGESVSEDELAWHPEHSEKPIETRSLLKEVIAKNIMFETLAEDYINNVIDAMEALTFKPQDTVLKEGELTNCFYIVEEGELMCSTELRGYRHDYGPGDTFGELSLMYDNTSQATITANTEVVVWKLKRTIFKKIITNYSLPVQAQFMKFIREVDVFNSFIDEDLRKMIQHSVHLNFLAGEVIIEQGSAEEKYFYLVESGEVQLKQGEEVVETILPHQFFGEVPIMNRTAPGATAVATIDAKLFRVPEAVLLGYDEEELEMLQQYSHKKIL